MLIENLKVKYPKCDRIYIGTGDGCVIEYSITRKKVIYESGIVFKNGQIHSMVITHDKSSLFLCAQDGFCKEFKIATRKWTNSYAIKNAIVCTVTKNDEFLFTASTQKTNNLSIWSIKTKQLINAWSSSVNCVVLTQYCSNDDKHQFIGFEDASLEIFDIQLNQTIMNIKALEKHFTSMAFTHDNLGAFICDFQGNIKLIKWKDNSNCKYDFDFSQVSTKVGSDQCMDICLTRDQKYLLAGSDYDFKIFDTSNMRKIKKFNFQSIVNGIEQIDGGRYAIISDETTQRIFDTETLKFLRPLPESDIGYITKIVLK